MDAHLQYPKFRWPVDLRLERIVDQEVLLLSCPIGVASEPLGLNPALAPILACFDGVLSVSQIVERFSASGVSTKLMEELVSLLDSRLFLVGPTFDDAYRRVRADFQAATVRLPVLAGRGYPSDPNALRDQINSYLKVKDDKHRFTSGRLLGAIIPHIDYNRGGDCYGITYNYLRDVECDLCVLLGTAHQFSHQHFHFTKKDFQSPLGILRCDRELVSLITDRHGQSRSFADEYLHKNEHSLELQLPFLQTINKDPLILPILVGSWADLYSGRKDPFAFEEFASFISIVAEQLLVRINSGQRILFIASVDLAHVGKAFGDQGLLKPDLMEEVQAQDMELIAAIKNFDIDALRQHVIADQDRRRICGFPTIFTLLTLLRRLSVSYAGSVYRYQQAVNYETDCAVSFCGMGLYVEY